MTQPTDTAPPGDVITDAQPVASATPPQRERSTIKFPYSDIKDAVTIAQAVKNNFGTSCTIDQLAAVLNQVTTSGAFRTKVASAQTFGAITVKRGTVQLTELGHRIADPERRTGALVDAFLAVPLYKEIFEKYRSTTLPEDPGLEQEIQNLGVVKNQVDRARQVFQRSAEAAGLFWGGRSRLVIPPNGMVEPGPKDPGAAKPPGDGEEDNLADSPLLQALWNTLPKDAPFTAEARRRFFTTLAFNIDYIYGPPDDGDFDPAALGKLWGLKTEPK